MLIDGGSGESSEQDFVLRDSLGLQTWRLGDRLGAEETYGLDFKGEKRLNIEDALKVTNREEPNICILFYLGKQSLITIKTLPECIDMGLGATDS